MAAQQIKYDEVKTEISVNVALAMPLGEIPEAVVNFFKAVSAILQRKEQLVKLRVLE